MTTRTAVPMCPIRPGDPCSLCEPGVTGPQDCGLVYLVMTDPALRDELSRLRRESPGRRTSDQVAAR
jgi:uncharacterized protein DUF6767